ncbi:MAG: RNA methyltransferase [Eubacterium sp.]|nr:RNA methyltransferase [Eubacterium sp.]
MITSTSNQQVKNLVQLQKKGKARREQGQFIVEGIRMFAEIPDAWIQQVYVSETFLLNNPDKLFGKTYEVLADKVFEYVSDTKTPQGVLGVVKMPAYTKKDLLTAADGRAPLVLLLENIQDPGNLGTMFRSGEGAGVTGIIMDKTTVDIFHPKTVRSTMGGIYRVPFIIVDDIKEGIRLLQEHRIRIYAAHLKESCCYDEPDYTTGCGFLIGNEGNGLTDETAEMADQYIRIPMGGKLESLNASVAASLLMYEANRQRRNCV